MRHHAPTPSPDIPPAHLEALRATPLHVALPHHGWSSELDGLGPAVLGVNDLDYDLARDLALQLVPQHHDVLGIESAGASVVPIDVVKGARVIAERSVFVRYLDLDLSLFDVTGGDLPKGAQAVNAQWHVYPERITTLAETLRRFRVIKPPGYGQLLAIARGVDCQHVDAGARELQQWRENRRQASWLARLSMGTYVRAEGRFREGRMLARLGQIAADLPQSVAGQAAIGLQLGAGHKSSFLKLLKSNGVSVASYRAAPLRWRYLGPEIMAKQWLNHALEQRGAA
jgi:hypothetical protein